ncbi:hypothetical protein BCh11DRAFT_07505 [Burkholderia sp. Ch1-1]|nr:hypothetical protein BCh11DRAFT_07505 [Burkholderia sp. Ch1-1]
MTHATSGCEKSHSPVSTFNRTPFSARANATSGDSPELAIFRDAYADMRGLLLEFTMATHFVRRGNRVVWPEFVAPESRLFGATFDIFVEDAGTIGLEVECKSVSHDKGRRFHQSESLILQGLVKRELEPLSKQLKSGLAVTLTVPDRLPTSPAELKCLVEQIRKQILANESKTLESGAHIRVSEFDPGLLRGIAIVPNSPAMRTVVETVTATKNRNAMILGRQDAGGIIFVAQSARDDTLLSAVFETASDAAKRQLTKTRPGLLVLGFDGIEADELRSVAEQDFTQAREPTALRVAVSSFLTSEARNHVVGVGFVSRGALRPQVDGSLDTGGSVYSFNKEESSYWHPDFLNIFSERAREA